MFQEFPILKREPVATVGVHLLQYTVRTVEKICVRASAIFLSVKTLEMKFSQNLDFRSLLSIWNCAVVRTYSYTCITGGRDDYRIKTEYLSEENTERHKTIIFKMSSFQWFFKTVHLKKIKFILSWLKNCPFIPLHYNTLQLLWNQFTITVV